MSDLASDLFRDAQAAGDRLLAARVWLTDAIRAAMQRGEDVAPALDLLRALEGIGFGHIDAMLRLPEGQKVGGKEPPPAETAIYAMAFAAIDRLGELGARNAIDVVAGKLGLERGSVASKRKHVMVERAKQPAQRKHYAGLIADYENEREQVAAQTEDQILRGLSNVAKFLGRK